MAIVSACNYPEDNSMKKSKHGQVSRWRYAEVKSIDRSDRETNAAGSRDDARFKTRCIGCGDLRSREVCPAATRFIKAEDRIAVSKIDAKRLSRCTTKGIETGAVLIEVFVLNTHLLLEAEVARGINAVGGL